MIYFHFRVSVVRMHFCAETKNIQTLTLKSNVLVFFVLPRRCGFRTEGPSGGSGSVTGRSNRPKPTLPPPTTWRCYRGPTATRRWVLSLATSSYYGRRQLQLHQPFLIKASVCVGHNHINHVSLQRLVTSYERRPQIRVWLETLRCHGWINGLAWDFLLAEHLSCRLDKGQTQDEVRGDAPCQFVKRRLGLQVLLSLSGSFWESNVQTSGVLRRRKCVEPSESWPETRSDLLERLVLCSMSPSWAALTLLAPWITFLWSPTSLVLVVDCELLAVVVALRQEIQVDGACCKDEAEGILKL